ncbi:MAG: long-chain fatty acid--CoA ligase [Planctomycetes bacterium]|nr:long-chain fatty acid--CoA ligase [Planctomycetota bacterium]
MVVKNSNEGFEQAPGAGPGDDSVGPAAATFPELLTGLIPTYGDRVFLPRRRAQSTEPVTFARLCRDVDALAMALLDLGLSRGDRVGLIADNRYEWLLVDLALASLGVVDVPRGSDTTPGEVQFILQHSGSRMCFVEDERVAREVQDAAVPEVQRVVVMQEKSGVDGTDSLGGLLAAGYASLQDAGAADRLAAARARITADDLLTIVYTSGTTAEPKGVMLTHGNVLANMRGVRQVLHFSEHDSFLSVLPAWHMYERILDYLALAVGAQLVYTDRRRIKDDLAEVRPTVFAAVPRIWEVLHDGIVQQAGKLTGVSGFLLRQALATSRRVGGRRAGLVPRLTHALLEPLVLKKVRERFGGRLRLCVSGGGALPRHVDETLLGIGMPILNGYGLTETSPVAALRRPERNDPGHIGPPLPQTNIEARRGDGTPCAIGETGVLWIRGPQVMRGYHKNPEATASVLVEQWFNSGDLGLIDERGEIRITGRAKDTIVLAGGENVEPEPVETLIKTSPLIEQAVCVGQDQKGLGALLVPALGVLEEQVPRAEWQLQDGVIGSKVVHDMMRRELDRVLTRENGCRPSERVVTFRVLAEPMTPENGLLTQTMKVRRHVVADRFGALLQSMFA